MVDEGTRTEGVDKLHGDLTINSLVEEALGQDQRSKLEDHRAFNKGHLLVTMNRQEMELDLDERPDFRVDAEALSFVLLEEGSKLFEHLLGQRRAHKQTKEPKRRINPKTLKKRSSISFKDLKGRKENEILGLHPL